MAPPLRVLPSVRVNKGVERRVEKWPWAPVASRLAAAPVCVCVYGCSRAGHRRVGKQQEQYKDGQLIMVRGGGASLPCDCDLEMANSDSGAPLSRRNSSLLPTLFRKKPQPPGGAHRSLLVETGFNGKVKGSKL